VAAGFEQQAGQGQRVRMARLAHRAELALAEDAGQHGERGRQAVPQVAGVRVGTVVEQQAGGPDGRLRADAGIVPGVREIQQRLPLERAALGRGQRRILGQQNAESIDIGCCRRRVHRGCGELRMRGEQLGGALPAGRVVVVAVTQARQR
jgi:hypothetical protein